MNKKKRLFTRSQITPFIIIGIVLLILISTISYITYSAKKQPFELKGEELSAPKLESSFSLYVQECIKNEGEEPLIRMGMQGGTLWPQEPNYLYYYNNKVSYLCYTEGLDPNWACVNSMLTKSQMEHELSLELKDRLEGCINLDEFRRFVDNISAGEMSVDVQIARDDVVVMLHYPVNMTFRDSTISISEYVASLDYPLGRLYSVSQDIINKEISDGYFDIDGWMIRYGADIIIEKHRPYPDKVYILKKDDYIFQFAMQNFPAVGQFTGEKRNYYGCCFDSTDDLCFKNTDPLRCVELSGEYNPNIGCSCAFSYEPKDPCTGDECNNCEDIGKEHGESWCVYDTIVGEGYDYVGSRHYKHSCINGTVYVEECRDYREELCTEQESDGMTTAVCRPNRWYTCSECITKACCEDSRYRDCYWDDSLDTKSRCIPQVPPGLRFWQNEGGDICLRGNQKEECDGLSCNQSWLNSAARYCYSQGDCGNYPNINNVMVHGSFYESDILKNVEDDIYPVGLNMNPMPNGTEWKLNLGFERESPGVVGAERESLDTISVFISALSNFLDQIANINPSAYLNPFSDRGELEVQAFSMCNLWTAPLSGSDCGKCSEDPLKPCTEYRCKSLGESCLFEMDDGVPKCERMSLIDFSSPVVRIDTSVISPDYTLERAHLLDYEGYEIIEPVRPHKPFTFGVETDEDTRCTISLTPRIEGYSLQTVVLGDAVFKKKHNITIRMPPRFVVPDKLYTAINFTSTGGIVDLFFDIKGALNSIIENHGPELEIYSMVTGDDLVDQLEPKVDSISDLIDRVTLDVDQVIRALLTQFDRGGYYVFFDCTDRAGNRNQNQVFIKFIVDYGYVDEEPPVIIQTDPENNGKISPSLESTAVSIYLDEPAECRYDYYDTGYETMNYTFSCPTGGYQLSPVAGGTFECHADVDIPFAENDIYIRCIDNPSRTDSHILSLVESETPEIKGIENFRTDLGASPLDYISYSDSVIDVPAGMLDELSFGINSTAVRLNLYLDEKKECRYSGFDKSFEEMADSFGSCITSDDIKKGVYKCSANLTPATQFERSIGSYLLNVDITDRNKTVDVNPERISIEGNVINLTFDRMLSGEDSIEINFTNINAVITINEDAQCSIRINDADDVTPMFCSGDGNKTLCQGQFDLTASSEIMFECENRTELDIQNQTHYFYLKCRDLNLSSRNMNAESYRYTLVKADELKIIDLKPAGVIDTTTAELSLRVSEDIVQNSVQCGFNDNPYSYLSMEKTGYRGFKADLSGLEEDKEYIYYVKCTDRHGSSVIETTSFKVII